MITHFKNILSRIIWPLMVGGGIYCTYFFAQNNFIGDFLSFWIAWECDIFGIPQQRIDGLLKNSTLELSFVFVLFVFVSLVMILEWVMPFNRNWKNKLDQVLYNDILYFIMNNIAANIVVPITTIIALRIYSYCVSYQGIWPTTWSLPGQIVLAIVISDFGSYWSHRLFHNVSFLWPFHATHHQMKHLSFVNAYTNHPVDHVRDVVLITVPIMVAGAPREVLFWHAVISTFVSILLHCNVEMRCGIFNYLFNTPELHRWHHSLVIQEANNNYSFNFVLWDVVFGTYYYPKRPFTEDIGIYKPLPENLLKQLILPFVNQRYYFSDEKSNLQKKAKQNVNLSDGTYFTKIWKTLWKL